MTGRTGLEAGWLGFTPGRSNLYRGAWHINEVFQRLRRFDWSGFPGAQPPLHWARFRTLGAGGDRVYRNSALTGVSNQQRGIISVWFRVIGFNANGPAYLWSTRDTGKGTGGRSRIYVNTAGRSFISIVNTVTPIPGAAYLFDTPAGTIVPGGWYHLLGSFDNSLNVRHGYLNDQNMVPLGGSVSGSGSAEWVQTDYQTSNDWASTLPNLLADIGHLYINTAEYLDLSVTANRRKFITSDLQEVNMNVDGSGPTGTAPAVYFAGPAIDWADNKGTGGAFSMTGDLTDDA